MSCSRVDPDFPRQTCLAPDAPTVGRNETNLELSGLVQEAKAFVLVLGDKLSAEENEAKRPFATPFLFHHPHKTLLEGHGVVVIHCDVSVIGTHAPATGNQWMEASHMK
jgi:hypothetical protein